MSVRRFAVPAAVLALALVLAGCQITITPTPTFPPSLAGNVTAEVTTSPSVLASASLAPGSVRYYRVSVPNPRDLLYVEAVGGSGLRVSLYSAGGTLRAVSESPAYFAGTVGDLSVAAGDVAGRSISVEFLCVGPCAATEPTSDVYYAAVANTAGSSRTFELYAYTFDATDANEPNDTQGGATLLFGAGQDEGAIEVLGDVDYFEYQASGAGDFFLVFTPFDLDLGLELEIFSPTCVDPGDCGPISGAPGDDVLGLLDGDVIRVRSASGRAGPSATSGYLIEVTDTLPLGSSAAR